MLLFLLQYYGGVHEMIHPFTLVDHDIVLTTFDVLKKEVYYATTGEWPHRNMLYSVCSVQETLAGNRSRSDTNCMSPCIFSMSHTLFEPHPF